MRLIIGSDHAGFELKEKVKNYLKKQGYDVEDVGAHKFVKTDDYPDYGKKVAEKVSKDNNSKGILFCGSAEGISIVANKFRNVRAVAVWTEQIAKLSREHNNANVLCLAGGKTVKPIPALSFAKAKKIIDVWLKVKFSKVPRHRRRVSKIKRIESKWKK